MADSHRLVWGLPRRLPTTRPRPQHSHIVAPRTTTPAKVPTTNSTGAMPGVSSGCGGGEALGSETFSEVLEALLKQLWELYDAEQLRRPPPPPPLPPLLSAQPDTGQAPRPRC